MTQPSFNQQTQAFYTAYMNQSHSIIRVLLEFGLHKNGEVAHWLITSYCYEYLIRTENLAALKQLVPVSREFIGHNILETCLNDLNHLASLQPPYQCRKSIRLQLYAEFIQRRRYPETWPWKLVLTVDGLTDRDRLDLLHVTHKAGHELPRQQDDDIIIISFLTSRREVPEYREYLEILIIMGFTVDARHHDIYEDYLEILLKRRCCDSNLWRSLMELPPNQALRCLDRVLDAQVDPATILSRQFGSKYLMIAIPAYIEYLGRPEAYQVLSHLFKRHRPDIWALALYCLYQPMTVVNRDFIRSLNISITIPELWTKKHCASWADVMVFQQDLRNKHLDFLLTVTPAEQAHLDAWIEQRRELIGDLDSNLILDLATIRTGDLIRFRGFESATDQVNEIIVPVRRCRLNRVDLAYGITIVDPANLPNSSKTTWIDRICQNPQPTYALKIRSTLPMNSRMTIRLFRIPHPSLLELCVLAVRRRYHRNDNPIKALPAELRDPIHPKWLTWAN